MFVLGFSASPRIKGNSDYLLTLFLEEAQKRGFETETIHGATAPYEPCIGCGVCEKKGHCSIKDNLESELFPLVRRADVIIFSSPVYFYGIPARMKGIIDRMQTLWSRKYRFDLKDPRESYKKGLLFSVGATRGMTLFDGIRLTTRYVLDAMGAQYVGERCYVGIDARGDIKHQEGLQEDMVTLADEVLSPLQQRKKVLFACRENAGRSQMAAAFARDMAGDRYDVISAGSEPAMVLHPQVIEAMAEKGLDIAYEHPRSLAEALSENQPIPVKDDTAVGHGETERKSDRASSPLPDMLVTMGCKEKCPYIPGCQMIDWNLSDPAGESIEAVRPIRDEIEKKVRALLLGAQ